MIGGAHFLLSFRKPLHFFLLASSLVPVNLREGISHPEPLHSRSFLGISGNVIMRCLLLIDGTICAMLCVSINIGFMIQYTSCVLRKGAGKHKHTHARSQLMCSRLENFLLGLLEMKTAALWMGKENANGFNFSTGKCATADANFLISTGFRLKRRVCEVRILSSQMRLKHRRMYTNPPCVRDKKLS